MLELLLGVLVVDDLVMLLWILTALKHHGDKCLELTPCVARIMNVVQGLLCISGVCVK